MFPLIPLLLPATGPRSSPTLAAHGSDTLVAWTDLGARHATGRGPAELVAVLLDPELAPRDNPLRLPLPDPQGRSASQALSCAGSLLLVIGGLGYNSPSPLHVLRLSASAEGLALQDELVVASDAAQARAACVGSSLALTWGEVQGSRFTEARAARVELGPGPLAAVPLPLPAPPASEEYAWPPFALEELGSGAWVGWFRRDPQGNAVLSGATFDLQRGASDPVRLHDFGQRWPSGFAASSRQDTVLITASTLDERAGGHVRLGLRAGANGRLDGPWTLAGAHADNSALAQILPDQDGWLVYWTQPFARVGGVHVPSQGEPTPAEVFQRPRQDFLRLSGNATLARRGADTLAVWIETRDPRAESLEVWVGRTPSDPPRLLSLAAPDQFDPAVASRGTEHLVLWAEAGEGGERLWGRWLAADGNPGEPFAMAQGRARAPAVAAGDRGYLAAWVSLGDDGWPRLYAQPLAPGARPEGEPVALSGPPGQPVVVWDAAGGRFLVGAQPDGVKIWPWREGQPVDKDAALHFPSLSSMGYMDGPFLGCGPLGCELAVAGASGDPWMAGASVVPGARLRELVELPVNHFVGGLAWGGARELVRTERLGDQQAALVWSELRGRRLRELQRAELPGNCHRPVAVVGDRVLIESRAPFGEGTVLVGERSREGLRVGPLMPATQLAAARAPGGRLLAAWTAWDPSLGAHRLRFETWPEVPAPAGPLLQDPCAP